MWLAVRTYGNLVAVIVRTMDNHVRGPHLSNCAERPVQHFFSIATFFIDVFEEPPTKSDVPVAPHRDHLFAQLYWQILVDIFFDIATFRMGIVSSDKFYKHASFVKFTFSPFF